MQNERGVVTPHKRVTTCPGGFSGTTVGPYELLTPLNIERIKGPMSLLSR